MTDCPSRWPGRLAARTRGALLALLCVAGAHGANAADLVPAPRSIAILGAPGSFAASCDVRSDAPAEDVYGLRLVRALLPLPGSPHAGTIAHILLRSANPPSIPAGAIAEQSYILEVSADRVVVTGATRAARLHGVETLRQLWLVGGGAVPEGRIADGPALGVRGLSIDVSRGRMPTAADLIAMLDLCAAFKLNVFQLYFEDTFQYSRVPVAARAACAMSPLTLRRVAAEARLRAIEFVPIVQTLAHQERLLSRPAMSAQAEHPGASMFAITQARTRDLVGSMVEDVLAASGSRAIHLGCDEATEIGEGASAARARRDGAEAVFADHVSALAARARTRWNARAWIYADPLRLHPQLVERLPRDLVLVDWDYDPATTFASLDTLARAGFERVITSPGLWDWSTVIPDYSRAFANIAAATSAARARACMGSVLASWGDGGGECLFGATVPGVAYFAECAWESGPVDRDAFLPRYCRLRFGDSAPRVETALRALGGLELPNGAYIDRLLNRPVLVKRRTPVWRDAVSAIALDAQRAQTALADATGRDLQAGAELEAMRAATGRLLVAADRERTLDQLAGSLETAPAGEPGAQARAATELSRLAAAEDSVQASFDRAWCAHNQASGLDSLRARFAAQRAALDSLRGAALRRELRAIEAPRALAGE